MSSKALATEDWVDAKAVGKSVGLHPKTIYRLARDVEGFPSIPVGPREKRFVLSDVKTWIAEHPERMKAAAEEYSTKRNVSAARSTTAKKAPAAKKAARGKSS